jgi:hypothetical protein
MVGWGGHLYGWVGWGYQQAYWEFVDCFRHAAERLRRGLEAKFPPGSFPPRLPYVPHLALVG